MDESGRGEQKEIVSETAVCSECGAMRCQLGHERRIEDYTAHLVQIFSELKRVLCDTGLALLNLGESFIGSGYEGDLKERDLSAVPWRTAIAIQESGWWLRFSFDWLKKSAMPHSGAGSHWEQHRVKVKQLRQLDAKTNAGMSRGDMPEHGGLGDNPWAEYADCPGCERCAPNNGLVLRMGSPRPTLSHEYWFAFAKNQNYFWDSDNLRIQHSTATLAEIQRASKWGKKKKETNKPNVEKYTGKQLTKHDLATGRTGDGLAYTDPLHTAAYHPLGRNYRTGDFWFASLDELIKEQTEYLAHLMDIREGQGMLLSPDGEPMGLVINPRGFMGEKYLPGEGLDHFASFCEPLIEPLVRAGSSPQICSKCHAPWLRVSNKETKVYAESENGENDGTNNKEPYQANNPHRERLRVDGRVDSDTKYDKKNANAGRLATYRQTARYNSKYQDEEYGQPLQGFARVDSIKTERDQSRIDAEELFPDDIYAQKAYVHYIHEHGATSNEVAVGYALSKVGQNLEEWKASCGADSEGEYAGEGKKDYAENGVQNPSDVKRRILAGMGKNQTVGWKASCRCNAPSEPSVVMDIFAGTFTTGVVALKLGRRAIMIEASKDYCRLGVARITKDAAQPGMV